MCPGNSGTHLLRLYQARRARPSTGLTALTRARMLLEDRLMVGFGRADSRAPIGKRSLRSTHGGTDDRRADREAPLSPRKIDWIRRFKIHPPGYAKTHPPVCSVTFT